MVESRRCGVFVGRVTGGRGALCCCQPMGSGSRFDPCMPCRFGVGRLACGLFIVGLFFVQQFDWYPVLSAVLWSACASWGRLRCSPCRCSRTLSLLSSRSNIDFLALYKQLKDPPPQFEGAGCKETSCGHTKIMKTHFVASVCTTICRFSWKKRLKMGISWSKNDFFWPQTSG